MATNKAASKSRAMTTPERGKGSGMTSNMSKEERERYLSKFDGQSYEETKAKAENYEDGGTTAKDALVGQEFTILLREEMPSTMGGDGYSVCHCKLASTGERVVFSDGGKGIHGKLREHEDNGGTYPLIVKQGLKRSDYPASNERPAGTTFWLNGKPSDSDVAAAGAVTNSSAAGKRGVAAATNGRARA